MSKLAIMYTNFGPYHLARLRKLTRLGREWGVEVIGLEVASREAIRDWKAEKPGDLNLLTIFPDRVAEEIPPLEQARGTWAVLQKLNPQAVALGLDKKTYPTGLTVLAWKFLHRRLAIVMTDSKYDDFPRYPLKEWIKRRLWSLYDGALVSGQAAREYALRLGMPPERIFVGCDVVDNNYFAQGAEEARKKAPQWRRRYGLPEDYFLYVGRFDEKKNVSGLLQAYHRYSRNKVDNPWHLVLCGSGPLEARLRQEVQELGLSRVLFAGFRQADELPVFYGLARCLVVPSSHSEQWGLVVNEAMAAGLPVLVSRACGCAPDLVQEGVNGFTFDPYDIGALARLMEDISSGGVDLKAMGEASRNLICAFPLDIFANNLLSLLDLSSS